MKTLPLNCAAAILLLALSGCQPTGTQSARTDPYSFGGPTNSFANSGNWFGNPNQIQARTPQEYQQYSGLANQVNQLNQRLAGFDSDNQQLHTEVAGLKQKLQLANDLNQQLKQQLADTARQFQQLQTQKVGIEQQLAAARGQFNPTGQSPFNPQNQAVNYGGRQPTQFAGTATIRANNSLLNRVRDIQIPGGQARLDGDVIRIEFPSDRLFSPGTYQIQPAQTPLMQNIVGTIRQSFPRQIVGIEAHWDGTPLQPAGTSDHQLTATQSLAVLNNLERLGLPRQQMFTMGLGSNRPRHPQGLVGGISPNRRIEIVIYPETYNSP